MKEQEVNKRLLIGIGNSARQDDGLGWAFLNRVERENKFPVDIHYRFQLNLDDAELISHYKEVIFVDASSEELDNGFSFTACSSHIETNFSTHVLSPETVLSICAALYSVYPVACILAIQGFQWEFKEGICPEANKNLDRALNWFNTVYNNQ